MEIGYGTEFQPDEQSKDQTELENSLAHREGDYDPGFHQENLYDVNEGAGGEVIDLRTGRKIDNSTVTDETIVQKQGGYIADRPLPIDEETKGDAADQWLAENDKEAA